MKKVLYGTDAGSACGKVILAALFCVGVIYAPLGNAAEKAAGTSDTSLAEIVVTAEKRESTVQATPISITAVTGDQLLTQGTQTVEQLVGATPGVSMRTAGPGQTEYEMRGLTSAGGSAATVGFYIDEVPLSASAVALNGRTVIDPELFDLSHAEVLRGPQGTLYGSGSMGGTIKLVTNPPKLGVFEGAADFSLSNTARGSANGGGSAMVNLPLGDIVALRLVGTEKYVSGWIDRIVVGNGSSPFPFPTNLSPATVPQGICLGYYCSRGDVQNAPVTKVIKGSNLEKFASGRATLLIKPSDALSVTTTLMYQRIDAQGYNNYQDPGTNQAIYQPYDTKEPYYDSFKMASLVVNYDFGPATLTSSTAYWKRDVFQSTDSTEALQNIFNTSTFIQNLYVEEDPTTQVSQELRLVSNGNSDFQWVTGLYASDLHSGYITTNAAAGFATANYCAFSGNTGGSAGCAPLTGYPGANPLGVVFNDNNPNIMKQSAIFGEMSYKLTSDLKLTAGLRYFKFDVSNISHQCGLGTGTGDQTCQDATAAGKGTNVLPKLNLSYTPTPDLTLYSTLAKGSRPGGVNLPIPLPTIQQLVANNGAYNCGLPLANQQDPNLPIPTGLTYVTKQPSYFGPDAVWSFEIGEKSRFDDRRFTLNADIYYIKWQDIQQVLSLSCGYPYTSNVGEARAYGPEVEFAAEIASGLTLNLSGTYTTAQITKPTIASGIVSGRQIINVPKYTVIATVDYVTDLGNDYKGRFRIASSLTGPIVDQAYYVENLPSHNFIDGRVGVEKGSWAAYLVGTNLTNKIAALTIDNTTFAWQQPTITRVSTNQPRTIGLDFQYKF